MIHWLLSFLIFLLLILPPILGDSVLFIRVLTNLFSIILGAFLFLILLSGKIKLTNGVKFLTILLLSLLFIGFSGNLLSEFHIANFPIFLDAFICYRNFIIFLAILLLTRNMNLKITIKVLSKISLFLTIIIFIFGILNFFIDIPTKNGIGPYEYRFGLPAYRFFFFNPGGLIAPCLCMIMIFLTNEEINKRKHKIAILLNLFILFLTVRSTAWGIIIMLPIISLVLFHYRRKLNLRTCLVLAGIIIAVSWWQVSAYFFNPNLEVEKVFRTYFFILSFDIALKNFPIGTGFASFGSSSAASYESPVYAYYNIFADADGSYGSNRNMHDCFWPIILGQFGFLGLFIICLVFIAMLKIINSIYISKRLLACYLFFLLLCFASLGNTTFFNVAYLPIFILMAIILNSAKSYKIGVSK